MDTTVSQNILFAVLSVFIAALTVALVWIAVCFVFLIKIIREILEGFRREGEKLSQDIDYLRNRFGATGAQIGTFLAFLKSFFKKRRASRDDAEM